ncbi:MAG: flagellar hook-basal body complex protein [Sarcina sp.]
MGVTFQFGEGSDLNGYTIKTGKINQPGTEAVLDKDNKTIILNGNFMDKGALTSAELADAINGELSKNGINQEVKAVGTPAVIPGLEAPIKGGLNGKLPENISVGDPAAVAITFAQEAELEKDKYSVLNGYTISVKQDTGTPASSDAIIDKSAKTITIKYDGANVAGAQTVVKDKINESFTGVNIETIDLVKLNGQSVKVSGGEDKKAPESIDVGGFTIKLPKGANLNDYNFKVVDIETAPLKAELKDKTVEISGDFLTSGAITAEDMKTALTNALGANLTGDLTVSGRAKIDIESESEMVDGGAEFKAPGDQELFGLNIKFDEGESLNGYKVVIGDISAGTKTSAKVLENEKTIVINGNFVTAGAVPASAIDSAVNKALKDKGIEQRVTITGEPNIQDGTESLEIAGGTPVQSLGEDGTISFVDGSQGVKAYDEGLKTLKIPDTVKMPGSDVELRVKSFNIDQQGIINCILEDGSVAAVGQLAIANFKNPEGLAKMGGNLYSQSANSGEATIRSGVGTRGEDNSKGYASTIQGMVEMSNVDLSEQFTDMITTTRAFQASGKIINTGDEILQDIINLKR